MIVALPGLFSYFFTVIRCLLQLVDELEDFQANSTTNEEMFYESLLWVPAIAMMLFTVTYICFF